MIHYFFRIGQYHTTVMLSPWLGELARGQGSLPGSGLGIAFRVVSNCTGYHMLCIFFY